MKKKLFLAGILSMALVFGFVLVGCKDDPPEDTATKFEGTWRNPYGNHPTYAFTNHTFDFTNDSGTAGSGTFTFTDTTITFVWSNGNTWSQGYSFPSGDLALANEGGASYYGTFVKQ
jgi:hypothetical protein